MFFCPFQPPIQSSLTLGNLSVEVESFAQHQGFSLSTATLPEGTKSQWVKWPIEAFSQLVYINKGSIQLSIPDRGLQQIECKNWFLLSDSNGSINLNVCEETELLWIECEKSVWESLNGDSTLTPNHLACLSCNKRNEILFVSGKYNSRMGSLTQDLFHLDGSMPVDRLKIASKSLELLSVTLDAQQFSERPQSAPCLNDEDQVALDMAARYLENNLSSPHSIPNLSRLVYLNEFKLKKGFRSHYDTTIFGYLRQKRMEHAHKLLLETNTSILEIASAVGYSNPSHFTRAFREEYGLNPSELKL